MAAAASNGGHFSSGGLKECSATFLSSASTGSICYVGNKGEIRWDGFQVASGDYIGVYAGIFNGYFIVASTRDVTFSYVNIGCDGVATGATSENDGFYNTTRMRAFSCGKSGFVAPAFCAAEKNGWYIPSIEELNFILQARSQIGGINTNGGRYLSSTEMNFGYSQKTYIFQPDGYPEYQPVTRNFSVYLRCIRKY